MNREIKFRAWDSNEKFFHTPMTIEQMLEICCLPSDAIGLMAVKFKITRSSLVFQQFSGLLDKNGKEIYEGDILASAWDTMLRLWLIEFSDGSFTNVNIGVDGYRGERFKLTQEKCSERVFVVNIFERPDLLK